MFRFKGPIIRPNTKHSPGTFRECTHCEIQLFTVHTLCAHSPGTFRECTHCGIHIVYSAHTMCTQSWYVQRVHTLWDPTLFIVELTLHFVCSLLADVFKMYVYM